MRRREEKESCLHSVAIAAPSRVFHCVCARVSVRACLPQETTTSIEDTHHNGHRYASRRNMRSKLRTYTSYGNVQTHVYAVNEVLVPHNAFAKHARDIYPQYQKTHTSMRSTHMMHKQVECIYSKTSTSRNMHLKLLAYISNKKVNILNAIHVQVS